MKGVMKGVFVLFLKEWGMACAWLLRIKLKKGLCEGPQHKEQFLNSILHLGHPKRSQETDTGAVHSSEKEKFNE